jgi:hypothetical protein
MAQRIGSAGLALAVLVGASIAGPPHDGLAPAVPAPDEVAIDGNGTAETDALLDCYSKFAGSQPDPTKISPPKITKSAANGYVLRADFRDRTNGGKVDRLTCSAMGFTTQKDLSVAPLYPLVESAPDIGTAKALAGWHERRNAEALKRATARRLAPPDAKTIALLEGVWLTGRKPDQGSCLSHWYLETQIEFDFQKSGGRALIFEYDLFTPVKLTGAEWNAGVLEIQGQDQAGGLVPFMRLRSAAPGHLELLPPDGKTGAATAMYRCGEPNRSVTADISAEQLAAFFSPSSGGVAFYPAPLGSSDADVCAGKVKRPWGFLLIEPYGPVHYSVFGTGFKDKHRFQFDVIRTIRPLAPNRIRLDMQERKKGDGWDTPNSQGTAYSLTIAKTGSRFEIPELGTSFVRCASGMHRW